MKEKQNNEIFSFNLLAVASMIYNCVMVLGLCYLAFAKDWWATLLLIPCCTLLPSLKTKESEKEDKDGK